MCVFDAEQRQLLTLSDDGMLCTWPAYITVICFWVFWVCTHDGKSGSELHACMFCVPVHRLTSILTLYLLHCDIPHYMPTLSHPHSVVHTNRCTRGKSC